MHSINLRFHSDSVPKCKSHPSIDVSGSLCLRFTGAMHDFILLLIFYQISADEIEEFCEWGTNAIKIFPF